MSMLNDSHSPAGTVLSLLITVAVVGASIAVSAVVVVVAAVVAVIVSGTLDIVAEKQSDETPLN